MNQIGQGSWTNPATRKVRLLLCLILSSGLLAAGCNKNKPVVDVESPAVTVVPEKLTMLVVGDSDLGPRIKRQWAARRDGTLTIVDVESETFARDGYKIPPEVDVILCPPLMLGDLVSNDRLVKVPRDVWASEELNKNELLRHFRTLVVQHADENWVVPLGSPCFSMMCNRPLFENAKVEPPESWDKMERCLRKLEASLVKDGASELSAKVDMPLGSGWAAHTFMARVAPSISHRGRLSTVFDRQTMNPLITELPFVEALKQLQAIATQRSLDLDPADVFELAINGQSSIALGWPARGFASNVDGDEEDAEENETEMLRIAPLPGVTTWFNKSSGNWAKRGPDDQSKVDLIGFAGMIAGVSSQTINDQAAWEFLIWLSSKSISLVTMNESPAVGPFRASHLGDVSRWTGDRISGEVSDEYAEVVSANHERLQAMIFPRIPSQHQYLKVLDEEVRLAIAGKKSAEDALSTASMKWDEITETLGRKDQVKNLKRTRGL